MFEGIGSGLRVLVEMLFAYLDKVEVPQVVAADPMLAVLGLVGVWLAVYVGRVLFGNVARGA